MSTRIISIIKNSAFRFLFTPVFLISSFLVVLLSGCGGANTSSGAGGVDTSSIAGNYAGSFTLTATPTSVPEAAITRSGTVTVEINAQGRMTVRLSNGGVILGSISSSGSFQVVESGTSAVADANCASGEILITGQVDIASDPDRVNGTFSSQGLVCDGLDVSLSGSLVADRG